MNTLLQNLDFTFTVENIPVHVLTIALCRQVLHVPFHSHGAGCYELHYIVSGKGEIHLKDGYFHTAPETFYMAGPHIEHSEISHKKEPMVEFCLYFHIDYCLPSIISGKKPILSALISQDLILERKGSCLLSLLEELKEELEKKPFGYGEYICGLLKQIFILCIRSSRSAASEGNSSSPQNLVLQKSVIAEDYFLYEYENLSLRELSRRLGLSTRQTERFLKEFYGQTFLEKRTQARMERALVLLGQPGQTVTSVSNALGYSSPEHFSGAFRKYFGSSPKNFLKKC